MLAGLCQLIFKKSQPLVKSLAIPTLNMEVGKGFWFRTVQNICSAIVFTFGSQGNDESNKKDLETFAN